MTVYSIQSLAKHFNTYETSRNCTFYLLFDIIYICKQLNYFTFEMSPFFSKNVKCNVSNISSMYARLCNIEILPSYISEVSVGDLLTVQALVTNPLDWNHFYEKILTIKKGDKSDFMVVTNEGDRLQGTGDIVEVDRWSNHGHYGFKVKINVKKQKSLTDRRTRVPRRVPPQSPEANKPEILTPPVAMQAVVVAPEIVNTKDMAAFKEMLKDSLAMDMPPA